MPQAGFNGFWLRDGQKVRWSGRIGNFLVWVCDRGNGNIERQIEKQVFQTILIGE
jgi:hypothetical protein